MTLSREVLALVNVAAVGPAAHHSEGVGESAGVELPARRL